MTTIRRPAARREPVHQPAGLALSPPEPRRRWALFAAGALAVCLGSLGSVWLYRSTTTAVPVVVAARTIDRGTVVERDDLAVVRVEPDVALRTVRGENLDALVGQRALFDVAQGSLLTPQTVGEQRAPGPGESLVSVSVSPAMIPTGLVAGDSVRLVTTSDESGTGTAVSARVAEIRPGSSDSTKTVVEVTVPKDSAAVLASLAAADVAVVLDSRDR